VGSKGEGWRGGVDIKSVNIGCYLFFLSDPPLGREEKES